MTVKASESTTEDLFMKFYGPTEFKRQSAIPDRFGFRSKAATGRAGRPDLFKDLGKWLIVVEAKRGTPGLKTNHAAAEDEVRYYMTENTVDPSVDIVGIAVSGQTPETLRATFYVALAPEETGAPRKVQTVKGIETLVSLEKIERLYRRAKYGEPLDDEKLTSFLKGLNETFHKNSRVRDTYRSLFFSALMIALNDDQFRAIYRHIRKPDDHTQVEAYDLNVAIVDAVARQLMKKVNSRSKQLDWQGQFGFIKTIDIPLDEYRRIIVDIDTHVHKPSKNSAKRDVLGKAYKIFLSRAGKIDNKNIILTPDHVKSLMVDLAELERGDVVLDTCTGSGGFLMEAMERLVAKTHGNEEVISHIHDHQLVGMEVDEVLFALACSNMFLHGDGRSNMIFRDSLVVRDKSLMVDGHDAVFRDDIKTLGPTKCIINPPYEGDLPVLFTASAIEYLSDGGRLVIIMPINTLEKTTGQVLDTLLAKASLDYVIEMPARLFFEQGRGVKTAIFGFTKKPHDKDSAVLFVDMNDDGHEVRTKHGRMDTGAWPDIRKGVLRAVRDRDEIDGISWKAAIHDGASWVPAGLKRNPYRVVEAGDLGETTSDYIEAVAARQEAQERMFGILSLAGIEGFGE